MFSQKIDDFHAPEVSLEVLFAVWSEEIVKRWRSTSALGKGFQKLGSWLRDAVIAQQRFAECCRQSLRSRDLLRAGGAKRVNDFVDELRIVCRVHRKRIADLKAQSPSGQIEFEMARILFRLRPAQAAIDQKFGGKRVGP